MKVYENTDRLPRSFIVGEAEVIKDDALLLAKLSQEDFNFRASVLLEEEAALWPKTTVPQVANLEVGQAIIQSYTPGEVRIITDSPINSYLVLTDNYYPGWQAFIDGQPQSIYRADYTFRAIQLPAGKHEVRFIYQPLSFKMGLGITIFTLIGMSTLFIGRFLKGRGLLSPSLNRLIT
jgi:hypothetical protein